MIYDGASQVIIAMDKFRGTATSLEVGHAIARVVDDHGLHADVQAMSDGGEGFFDAFDAFDGDVVRVDVPGPLGHLVAARVKLLTASPQVTAVIEVSDVVGRDLLPSPSADEALRASSEGVAHVIIAASQLGADRVVLGCGGTATSDGGLGCYRVLAENGGLPVTVVAATDVTTRFSGARGFAIQKGIRPEDLALIEQRLHDARLRYLNDTGVDVDTMERTGAAGGIAGSLAALGATLRSGIDVVAASVGLHSRLANASLVVTGEGRFDEGSLEGKTPVSIARLLGPKAPLLVVCGSVVPEAARRFLSQFPSANVVSLEVEFGLARAMSDVRSCVSSVVHDELQRLFPVV